MSTLAEPTYGVKLSYEGQMRRFPVAKGTSFKDLRDQVLALLSLPKDADVLLKYSDEEGDLITISSDLELTSALAPGKLLRLTVGRKGAVGGGGVNYPTLDAPMLDVPIDGVPAPSAPHAGDAFRSLADGPAVGGPAGLPPGFVGGPGPHAHPHGFGGPGPHEHPHGFGGPYRGGLGFRGGHGPHGRGGFGHHGRGGFGHHGRGFHGHGPYMHPHAAGLSREDWRSMTKEDKEARKEMKREWKEAHKSMKREWKQGGGRGRLQCADGMQWGWAKPDNTDDRFVARFAKDVTIPDGTQLQPKTPFVKTWRLRNEGPAWPAGCVLRFLGKHSDIMGSAEAVPLPLEAVATNTEVEVSVNLVAPEKPGRYTGYWKMCTPDGRKFGQRVWVSIVVPGSPNSTSSSSDSDREADRYESLVDTVLATGMIVKRHRILRMLKKYDGNVNLVCEKLAKKDEKKARKAMRKQMKI